MNMAPATMYTFDSHVHSLASIETATPAVAPPCQGIAHLLEHLAFKGTPRIGSRNWQQESGLLWSLDEGEEAANSIALKLL